MNKVILIGNLTKDPEQSYTPSNICVCRFTVAVNRSYSSQNGDKQTDFLLYPTAASGFPWTAASMQVKGDPMADLCEDLGAEQKARVTYDNILRLSDDPDVNDVIKFLREREIVHFQRFGEAVQLLREKLNQKNVYCMNPAFDM